MGNYFSKSTQNANSDWDNFLTSSQANVQRIYQNDEPLPVISQKVATTTKEKETYRLDINQYIEEKVQIEADPEIANNFFVEMKIRNKTPEKQFRIKVYQFASTKINFQTELFEGITRKGDKEPQEYYLTGEEYNLIFPFFLGDNPTKFDPSTNIYPIIVEIIHDQGFKTIYKYTLEVKDEWAPHLVEKGLVLNGKYSILKNVYGLKNSSLTNNPNSEKCLICMTNDIEIMISPCNHMCLCSECTESLKETTNLCPICRRAIGSFVRMVLRNNNNQISEKVN